MKAILTTSPGGPDQLTYTTVPRPRPGPGQILIKTAATSVNRPDIIQREGNYPPPPGDSPILGLEAAGTVHKVGPNVTNWHPGDRVMALLGGGGYAQYALARADHAIPTPPNLTDQQAACICETYLTAYLNLFLIAGLATPPQKTLLIHGGGGGVSTAAIHLCRHLSPDTTLIVTASPAKIARVRALGVPHVIDYQSAPFAPQVKTLTAGHGADIILDHIGAPYLTPNLQCLATAGTLLSIGVHGGPTALLNIARLMVKRQRIIGSVLRSRPPLEKAALIADFTETALPLFANGLITPLISVTYPLSQAAEAHRTMQSSTHFGKIVLTT